MKLQIFYTNIKKRIMYNDLLPKNIHIAQRIQGKVNFGQKI